MDLFIEPSLAFEKVAAEVALSEDPNGWPNEIVQELYKQVPYVADFDPNVVLDRVDAERGFGFGHIEISNKTAMQQGAGPDALEAAGVRHARIPIIIRDRKLAPFDVIVTSDSKMLPLTEARLRQAIFRPQAFDMTGKQPGDQSMVGQLYPPQRGYMGMGGLGAGEMGKMGGVKQALNVSTVGSYLKKQTNPQALAGASKSLLGRGAQQVAEGGAAAAKGQKYLLAGNIAAQRVQKLGAAEACKACGKEKCACAETGKTASLLEAILPTINESHYHAFFEELSEPGLQAAFMKNAYATAPALKALAEYTPMSTSKTAAALADNVTPSVVQLRHEAGTYVVKSASHKFWAVREQTMSRPEALALFGDKTVLAADLSGSATLATGEGTQEQAEDDKAELITQFGIYKVQDDSGRHLIGYVFPNLLDVDGKALPLALFTNGSQAAVQGEIVGINVGGGASLFEGEPRGYGCFYEVLPNGRAQATIPLHVHATVSRDTMADSDPGITLMAETFDGREIQVLVQPNITRVVAGEEGHMLVSTTMRWLPLEKAESVGLTSDPETFSKTAQATRPFASVLIRSGGVDSFSFDGMPIAKLAEEARSFLTTDESMFLLGALGVHPEYGAKKLAEALTGERPIEVKVARHLRPASESYEQAKKEAAALLASFPPLRRVLTKEAAVIPNPTAVDTVLSLGFLNPENAGVFVAYLPTLDDAQGKMCELLVAARLGLPEIPVSALERAVRSMEDVIEGLRVLAFSES
jgi:hypothetical protein